MDMRSFPVVIGPVKSFDFIESIAYLLTFYRGIPIEAKFDKSRKRREKRIED